MSKNKQIGRYQVIKKLARGRMGVVFQAYDPNFERKVAVKVLLKRFRNNPSFRARFEQEVRIVAGLNHSAIVPVYDLGEEWQRPYLVMRYMRGGSLKHRLQHGALPLEEASDILIRLADGLDQAHQKGIIHRDIKPANILFDAQRKAYLSDFGIAHLIIPNHVTTATWPVYMAPEQRIGKNPDHRSDIYSLGMVLLEMLTGPLPSEWQTHPPLLNEILTQLHSKSNLPQSTYRVITRALTIKRQNRFARANDFAHAFATAIIDQDPPIHMPPVQAPTLAIKDEEDGEEDRDNQERGEDQKPVPLMAWVILGSITLTLLLYSY